MAGFQTFARGRISPFADNLDAHDVNDPQWTGRSVRKPMDADRAEVLAKLQELRARFADAHRRAMDCLERGDWHEFGDVAKEEGRLLEEQAALIRELRDA